MDGWSGYHLDCYDYLCKLSAKWDMHWTATWSYIIATTLVHFDEDRNHFTSRSQAMLALTSRSMGKLIPKLSASVNNSLEYMWLKKSDTIKKLKKEITCSFYFKTKLCCYLQFKESLAINNSKPTSISRSTSCRSYPPLSHPWSAPTTWQKGKWR